MFNALNSDRVPEVVFATVGAFKAKETRTMLQCGYIRERGGTSQQVTPLFSRKEVEREKRFRNNQKLDFLRFLNLIRPTPAAKLR